MSILTHSERAPHNARQQALVSRANPRDRARLKQLGLAVFGISLALVAMITIVALKTGATFWLHRF
jgi:hypothetical protein